MINLKCRTEFSFREVFGSVERVLEATEGPVGICDRSGTWGHVHFESECCKLGRKALLGAELAVVENATLRERQGINWMSFLARNNEGLRELYELVTRSTAEENYYYIPRIDYRILSEVSPNLIALSGSHPVWARLPKKLSLFVELSPSSHRQNMDMANRLKLPIVATSDNFYPTVSDKRVYEVISGRERQMRTSAMHLLNEWEWEMMWPGAQQALWNTEKIAEECNASLPRAEMVHFDNPVPLRKLCERAARDRGIDLKNPVYRDRLKRELDLISEKQFEDYFYLVADIISYAKKHMLVGPARGSSCGSIVCYLLSITEIDPIPYDLLFERFIDVNRKDLPDIDIDFPDDRRDMVFAYIENKYGKECVARLGTILRYKAKSAITDVAKALNIPQWEVSDLKNAIIERSGGDARAAFCIMDTFRDLEIGKATLEKYPQLSIAGEIENHAKAKGQHAAGVVVTADPVMRYCSVDKKSGAAQVDKKDAETLNLLKIDALGLRTLSVIQDCLDQVSWTREKLIQYPTDDEDAFSILNAGRFSGIFQFEGYALQSLCKQLTVENFEDIASLTALARPGPLNSGGAAEFLRRRVGHSETVHLHPLIAHTTKVTYGVVIYQEQVMQIAREMGRLSWEDVSSLRKAMSKSLGKEFFDSYWERFREGALAQGVKEDDAQTVWENINTMGSWSFNRSHAVAYGMVSYWTLVLKSKFPLEFATACLRNARDNDQCIQLLRELHREGFRYRAFDPELSEKNWTVQRGILIGGLLNVKGIGEKIADDIVSRRKRGEDLTTGQKNKLANGVTPFDTIFECADKFSHIKKNPSAYNIKTAISDIGSLTQEDEGSYLVMGKIKAKDLRDLNDLSSIQKRGGRRIKGQSLILNLDTEDDTGAIRITIDRHHYVRWGLPLVETAKVGDWLLFRGELKRGFRRLYCTRWRKLDAEV